MSKDFAILGFKKIFFDANCALTAQICYRTALQYPHALISVKKEEKKTLIKVSAAGEKIVSNQLPHTFLKDPSVHFLLFWVRVKRDSN